MKAKLNLADSDGSIMDAIQELNVKCAKWITNPVRPAPSTTYELPVDSPGPPAIIMDELPPRDVALDDRAVFAL
jgi:hypothetical protein